MFEVQSQKQRETRVENTLNTVAAAAVVSNTEHNG